MVLKQAASAGTLESSDVQVIIEAGENGIELDLESTVINQYGKLIRSIVLETLERLDVQNCKISINDHGALDCTIKARVETAVFRASQQSDNIDWGGTIR